jgi:phage terminase large subunit
MKQLIIRCAFLIVLAASALAAAQNKQTFVGMITDDMCPKADHSQMQMGPTSAKCTIACIQDHGASYVLYDGKNVYTLSDQQKPKTFSGKKVQVTGTLDSKTRTIRVDSIALAK